MERIMNEFMEGFTQIGKLMMLGAEYHGTLNQV